MIQWQIIWQPDTGEVTWRTHSAHKPGPIRSIRLMDRLSSKTSCRICRVDNPDLALEGAELAARIDRQIRHAMKVRTGSVDKNLAAQITRYSLQLDL